MNRLPASVYALITGGLLAAPNLPHASALAVTTEVADSTPIWQWVASALMAVVCGVVVFMNSKRSHQG